MSILSQIGILILIGCIIFILVRSNKTLEKAAEEGEHFVDEWALRQQKKEERLLEKEEREQERKERLREKREQRLTNRRQKRQEELWDAEADDDWDEDERWEEESDDEPQDDRWRADDDWTRENDQDENNGWEAGRTGTKSPAGMWNPEIRRSSPCTNTGIRASRWYSWMKRIGRFRGPA